MTEPLSPAMEKKLIETLGNQYDVPLVSGDIRTVRALIARKLAWVEKYRDNNGEEVQRALLTPEGLARAARLAAAQETPRPRCTCGALDYPGCFCEINLRDFLATSPNRRP